MKILYLCDQYYWNNKTSRVRFHAINALFRHPEVVGIKDGPGFDGWKDVPTSVEQHQPEYLFWYKPLAMAGYDKVTLPKIISYNEAYDIQGTTDEILRSHSNIVIFHYKNTMKDFAHLKKKGIQRFNIPHCIEKTIFKDYEYPKCYDILFTGSHSKSSYPLRHRLHQLLQSGCFDAYRVKIRKHPGKRIDNVDEQVIEYAHDLNKAKIVFTCSMTYKNAVAKYSEIPACNALLIGDFPDERREFFQQFLVGVDQDMDDTTIIKTVTYWLSHEKERMIRARRGMELTLSSYTQEHYAARLVDTLHSYGHGKLL